MVKKPEDSKIRRPYQMPAVRKVELQADVAVRMASCASPHVCSSGTYCW